MAAAGLLLSAAPATALAEAPAKAAQADTAGKPRHKYRKNLSKIWYNRAAMRYATLHWKDALPETAGKPTGCYDPGLPSWTLHDVKTSLIGNPSARWSPPPGKYSDGCRTFDGINVQRYFKRLAAAKDLQMAYAMFRSTAHELGHLIMTTHWGWNARQEHESPLGGGVMALGQPVPTQCAPEWPRCKQFEQYLLRRGFRRR